MSVHNLIGRCSGQSVIPNEVDIRTLSYKTRWMQASLASQETGNSAVAAIARRTAMAYLPNYRVVNSLPFFVQPHQI